jgi:TRAP-type C4-dicarboxylate transport system permease small subunit
MPSQDSSARGERRRFGLLFYIGAAGLLIAMTIEAIAVIGRQIGMPLLGALEIIQAAILLTAASSMLTATLSDAHATVHLLVERVAPRPKLWLHRVAMVVSALFFACLAVAAAWLTLEAWNDFEHSELLHIPYRPLRVIVVVASAAVAIVFAYKAVKHVAKGRDA